MVNLSIQEQLTKIKIPYEEVSEIYSKDGIYIYSVKSGRKNYVLKYFEKEEYRREIKNYLILHQLNIPTIPLIAYTDKSILLINIEESNKYRFGTQNDMNDTEIFTKLARWYHMLHEKGKAYVKKYGNNMYMETDCITAKNIAFIESKTQTQDYVVWRIIERNLNRLNNIINETEKTLTYNDFYYSNMIVAKDKSEAFMFDYNLLGKGYVYSDIKNVICELGECAKKAFIDIYGKYNHDEILLHEVAGTLVALYSASCQDVFPQWGYQELEFVKNGYLLKCTKQLFSDN